LRWLLSLVLGRRLCVGRWTSLFPLVLGWCLTALVLSPSRSWLGVLLPFVALRVRRGACADKK
jgi:hypothetical protein